ncbi:MAG TPA: heat-shock protein Hsp20 [Prolixibacteraceae bacterium]|nr:heat-shock protein Hsp20 [Prolixibacteraceae bacterium]HCR92134.1 heat-shock protein Hsp20 [Prolixibacteraceae bacterium]HCU61541.1 heat-shock protein Hsp20 [Prolixibacteraceae bacterium]
MEDKAMLPVFKTNRNLPGIADNFFSKNLWDDFFNEREWSSSPDVNIMESSEHYEIEIAAPGLEKKDFHIDLKDNVLTVSSEKKTEHKERQGLKIVRREFSYSSFSRSFVIPEGVDFSKINASHSNGILKIELPKKEEFKDQEPRQIAIK